MNGLSHVLPPLASDYSGACSLLYGHGLTTVVCDAACCTNNYLYCDEPRWRTAKKNVYCISLRTLDVTLGNERALVERIVRTVRQAQAEVPAIALVATPVPAITGMDVEGMACEVEQATGIPSLGIPTGGFRGYGSGMLAAFKALLGRFGGRRGEVPHEGTFVLGAGPFDFGIKGALAEELRKLRGGEACDLYPDVLADPAADTGLEVFASLARAKRVVAASSAGVEMAKVLERRFGVGWEAGVRMDFPAAEGLAGAGRVLVVHDQVVANSIRDAVERGGGCGAVRVASLGGWHAELARTDDARTPDEGSLKALLRSWQPDVVVGDPLLEGVVRAAGCAGCRLVPLPWPALSGRLGW